MSTTSSKAPIAPDTLTAVRSLVFPPGRQSANDINRWHQETFAFSEDAATRFALVQHQGGPCGLLASAQAFIIANLQARQIRSGENALLPSPDALQEAFDTTLTDMLRRAAMAPRASSADESTPTVVILTFGNASGAAFELNTPADAVETLSVLAADEDAVLAAVQASRAQWMKPSGVVLLLFSLVLSRGVENVRGDMDDLDGALTGQFGYCNQELVNLLLTGCAVSQVHDGVVPLGETGMVLRGVATRPQIGFLTKLEALRYCAVGSFYKNPELPIWVIGSESHFTVIFAEDPSTQVQTAAEGAVDRARRAFNQYDSQENGFIAPDKLRAVLVDLGIEDMYSMQMQTNLAMDGIVMWSSFWNAVEKRLLADGGAGPSADERLARELAYSDQDSAWKCPTCTYDNSGLLTACEMCTTPKPSAESGMQVASSSEGAQVASKTMAMCHINGIAKLVQGTRQGPTLTKFTLTTVDPALAGPASGGHGEDLAEVLHTRWPGAALEWPSGTILPSITG